MNDVAGRVVAVIWLGLVGVAGCEAERPANDPDPVVVHAGGDEATGDDPDASGSGGATDGSEIGPDGPGAIADPSGAQQSDSEPNEGCVGPPECQAFAQHSPDCSYAPVVEEPAFDFCCGPVVWVDTTHENWHQITPESADQPGRYWGFAQLLFADGYDVRDSEAPLDELVVGEGPDVLVIASAYRPDAEPEALSDAETQAVTAWVRGGGSLLLVFDHPPFDRVGDLLAEFGLEQVPAGADTMRHVIFRRYFGTLTPTYPLTAGVYRVSQFRGSAFDIVDDPPAGVVIQPVLTFGEGEIALVDDAWVAIDGRLGGAMLRVGQGRVYVSAEAAGFTAQTTVVGAPFIGMHVTPYNERYLLNIMHWLDGP